MNSSDSCENGTNAESPKADLQASIDFLKQWLPAGPWVLTAIAPDRHAIQTATFGPKTVDSLSKWLSEYNEKRNLYFQVNPAKHVLTKKAVKEDIREFAWLHVDVDPRAGEPLLKEQDRIFSLLSEPPNGVPAPTAIVYSGGGYQGFWKLASPVELTGSDVVAEMERYNMQLELVFGADSCHNVDRIMRLPGTVNIPDRKKRSKGRKVALAGLLCWTGVTYSLEQFEQAPALHTPPVTGSGATTPEVVIGGSVERLEDVHALDDHAASGPVPDWCKVLIVQGEDPDDPQKYGSRSEALFSACCELVRRGVPDDVIYSTITDPDFRISSSVIDKGRGMERYAIRQIERAKEDAIDPNLRELNERFAVIENWGGKCRVIEELYEPTMKRTRITKQSFEDFRNRFMHRKVKIGVDANGEDKHAPLGKWWLAQPNRRQYTSLIFAPGHEIQDSYNLWRGFACDAKPGDKHELLLEHILKVICTNNEKNYEYMLNWMARAVQHPDSPGEVAIVLRGKRGTGKSVFATAFGSLWGRHFLHVSDPKHLVGSFNSHLRDCVVLFGDEAFFAGDKKHESMLKTLITESSLVIEAKGVDAEVSPNFTHLILASNSEWVVPAGDNERRYVILDVGQSRMRDFDYFKRLKDELDSGGRENLLHFLLNRDISEFEHRDLPMTAALRDQKIRSLSVEQEWWHRKLVDGQLLHHHSDWTCKAAVNSLIDDFLTYANRQGVGRRSNATVLLAFLAQATPGGWPKRRRETTQTQVEDLHGNLRLVDRRQYVLEFPSLQECRAFWDAKLGDRFDWDDFEEEPEHF